MKVTGEDELLQWPNEFFQEVQPLLFVLNLIHVNVAGGYVFVATRQSWILPRKLSYNIEIPITLLNYNR